MASVLLPLAQGFEEVEAVSLIDVLRRGGVDVRIAHMDGEADTNMVLGANGITIKADTSIANVISEDFDMILLPGGWEGTYTLADNETVQRLLKEFKANDKIVGAICAAPYALKQAGVLGNDYTCYPSVEERNKPSRIPRQRDGDYRWRYHDLTRTRNSFMFWTCDCKTVGGC